MADYDVGYGKPPRSSQFQSGQSGNPRGRPKGARGLKAELRAELDELVAITFEGKTRRVRKLRLVIKSLTARALKGDVRASELLLRYFATAFGLEDERSEKKAMSATDRLILAQLLGDADAPADIGGKAPASNPAILPNAKDSGTHAEGDTP